MSLTDYFEEDTTSQTEPIDEGISEEKSIDFTGIIEKLGELISGRFDASEYEKQQFVSQFAFWGGILLSIVGIEDLTDSLKILKPLPVVAKIGIILGGMVLLVIVLKPKKPKVQQDIPSYTPAPPSKVTSEPVRSNKPQGNIVNAIIPDYKNLQNNSMSNNEDKREEKENE